MAARAQDPLWINTRSLKVCDTIQFEWDGTAIGKGYKLASLHVWMISMVAPAGNIDTRSSTAERLVHWKFLPP